MKLNLGCGDRHIKDHLCIDIAPPPCEMCDIAGHHTFPKPLPIDRAVDLEQYWPWKESSIEEIMALDVCEHIRTHTIDGRIHFMNEAHRVLVPGGRITIETPDASRGVGYWQDPTHCSPWARSAFKYFEAGTFAHGRLSKAYGITAAFRTISIQELGPMSGEDPSEVVWKIRAVLEAVK